MWKLKDWNNIVSGADLIDRLKVHADIFEVLKTCCECWKKQMLESRMNGWVTDRLE